MVRLDFGSEVSNIPYISKYIAGIPSIRLVEKIVEEKNSEDSLARALTIGMGLKRPIRGIYSKLINSNNG